MTDITRLINDLNHRMHSAQNLGFDFLFLKLDDLGVIADTLETALRANTAQTDHVEQLQQRIAELESRTVKLPLPRRKTADDYVDDTFEPCDLAAIYNACRLECEVKFKNALAAAGIKVEVVSG
ncbi:hypothetical protein JJ665_27750 (plasmid) [Klebsiella pneumoniae]|nr:hypothetical protein JJ665_27750 [Klebsiella pneumoniae]